MIKKIIFSSLLLITSVSSYACQITISSGNPEVFQVLKRFGLSPKNYDQVCLALRNHNAGLEIVADSGRFSNALVAHSTIMIKDKKKPVYTSSHSNTTTKMSRNLEGDESYLMYEAIMSSLEDLNIPKMTQSLKEARVQMNKE